MSWTGDSSGLLAVEGDKVTLQGQTKVAPKDSESVEGIWTNSSDNYSLSLSAIENSSTSYRLAVGVGNTLSGRVEVQDDGSWKVSGPMISTMAMPPPQIFEVQVRVFKLFESLSNVKREGDALVITFGSGEQQKFEPKARPEPASKDKINWMK